MKVFLKDIGFTVSAYKERIPVDGIPVLPINFYNPDKLLWCKNPPLFMT